MSTTILRKGFALLLVFAACAPTNASTSPSGDPVETEDSALKEHPASRISVRLDDGSQVTVDNISRLTSDTVQNVVLAADRSTQTGCPFDKAVKGLIRAGDRVVVTDTYLAWFDFSLGDGVAPPAGWIGPSTYSRSGALAGLWTLDRASTSEAPFLHFAGADDPSNGICWNWPRNELIPGSASPSGQLYWWDVYAPPLEHTIAVSESADGSRWDFFSSVYAQGAADSGFSVSTDGAQPDGKIHYATQSSMTSWHGATEFASATQPGVSGSIRSTLEYICGASGIDVVWKFSPSIDASANNLYAALWLSYAGQNPTTCGEPYPLPSTALGAQYGCATSSLPVQASAGRGSPGKTACFDSKYAQPCQGYNLDLNAAKGSGPIPASAWIETTQLNGPTWRMRNRIAPNSGDGTLQQPLGFPFDRFVTSYENSDQTISMSLVRGPYPSDPTKWYTLSAGRWYGVHYTLSPVVSP